MQKIIFFTPIPGTNKLASVITDETPEHLISEGIIPADSKYVIVSYNQESLEQRAALFHIEYMRFDNPNNPKQIVLDKDMLAVALLQDVRTKRLELLEELDYLQFRASVVGKKDLVDEIEADKARLRNLPSNIDFSDKNTIPDMYNIDVVDIFVNYNEKYESRLKK